MNATRGDDEVRRRLHAWWAAEASGGYGSEQ